MEQATDVVIIGAVRTAVGRRNGGLSTMHAIDLLGCTQAELFSRSQVDPAVVEQVVGGCVMSVGMQALNITRTAWLAAGLPLGVAATTVDTQCGSSQQATSMAYAMVASGMVDATVACGVEIMSRVPPGSTVPKDPDVGRPVNRTYREHYEFTTQFEGAERLVQKFGLSRDECDALGVVSQTRAAEAIVAGRFTDQIVPVDAPDVDDAGKPTGSTHRVDTDECPRSTTLEGLTGLKPVVQPDGLHTAGTTSQIADGASALLLMSRRRAAELGVEPLATIVDTCMVGCDPEVMLEGPVVATKKLLSKHGLSIDDLDLIEINEAFAAVVLAWEQELKADMDRVNPNGGAIALGHPLGATGSLLIGKAVHELVRTDGEQALVTMCCAGGLGTGTLLRRG